MYKVLRPRFLFLFLVLLIFASFSSAVSPINVLIVNDGHVIGNEQAPDHRFLPHYKEALSGIENVKIDVYNTTPAGLGPEADTMSQYNVVIWYTLGDYGDHSACPISETATFNGITQGACRTLYGDPDDTYENSGSGDIEQLTDFMFWKDSGNIFLTGHNLHRDLSGSKLAVDWFGIKDNPEQAYYLCSDTGDNCQPQNTPKSQIDNLLRGEGDDPITENWEFQMEINFSREPAGDRWIFADEKNGQEAVYDDNFRWIKNSVSNQYWIESDGTLGGNDNPDDTAHSLIRMQKQGKRVIAGFGFESIIGEQDRKRFMENLIYFLVGPQADDVRVRTADQSRYTNDKIDVAATCINQQKSIETGITLAQFFVEGDTGIPQNPRTQNSERTGIGMDAHDGVFDESTENVKYVAYDAAGKVGDETMPRGTNQTLAVHCRDNDDYPNNAYDTRYWGPMEETWFIVDIVPPESPASVDLPDYQVSNPMQDLYVIYETDENIVSQEYRPDKVRVSCDRERWSQWFAYGFTQNQESYSVNITSPKNGCSTEEGNRTMYVQVQDHAGNTADRLENDWVVYNTSASTAQEEENNTEGNEASSAEEGSELVVTIDSPSSGEQLPTGGTVTVVAQVTDGNGSAVTGASVTVNGELMKDDGSGPDNTADDGTYARNYVLPGDGESHTISVVGRKNGVKQTTERTISLIPGIAISSVTVQDEYVVGDTVHVSGQLNMKRSLHNPQVDATFFGPEGTEYGTETDTHLEGTSFSISYLVTSEFPTGTWTVNLVGRDDRGSTDPVQQSFTVNPPAQDGYYLAFIEPDERILRRGQTVNLRVRPVDAMSGNTIEVKTLQCTFGSRSVPLEKQDMHYTSRITISENMSIGKHPVTCDAVREAHSQELSRQGDIQIEVVPRELEVTMQQPADQVIPGNKYQVAARVQSGEETVSNATVNVFFDGKQSSYMLAHRGNGTYQGNVTVPENATSISVQAKDAAGNVGESETRVISNMQDQGISLIWVLVAGLFGVVGIGTFVYQYRTGAVQLSPEQRAQQRLERRIDHVEEQIEDLERKERSIQNSMKDAEKNYYSRGIDKENYISMMEKYEKEKTQVSNELEELYQSLDELKSRLMEQR